MTKPFLRRFIFSALLALYVVFMAYVLFFKYVPPRAVLGEARTYHRSLELVPFNQIYNYLSGTYQVSPLIVVANLLGNIIIFIPLGIYFSIFRSRHSRVPSLSHLSFCLLLVFLCSLSTEILQYIFELGASDADDILLNCLGGLIGILIHQSFRGGRHNPDL